MKKRTKPSRQAVTGIGGIFFRAKNAAALSAWYAKHLGVPAKDCLAEFAWREKQNPKRLGRTVWSIFPKDTDYFGPRKPAFMINYCVANLDRLLAQLRRARVKIDKVEDFDYGRFAWITDPDGNRIELWQPTE